MAVSLIIADLKQPQGELDSALFPLGDIDTLLTGWLAQAVVKVAASGIATADHNDAAAAWCYHRAYRHVADRLAMEPAVASIESGVSRTFVVDQRAYFAALAAAKLAEYTALDVDVIVLPAAVSTKVSTVATW